METLRERFFNSLDFANKSKMTIRQYKPRLAHLNKFLKDNYDLSLDTKEDVQKIDGMMMEDYQQMLRKSGMSPVNEVSHVAAIGSFFSYLTKLLIIKSDSNPAAILIRVKVPKKEQPHFSWTEAEEMIRKFSSRNGKRDLAILGIALTVGLRVSAIANLRIKDIDEENREITFVNKGGSTKTMFLADEILEAIECYISQFRIDAKPDDPLFISERGNKISTDAIRNICKNAGKLIGKKGTPHAMRRTCLTRIDEIQGRELAQIIGTHSDKKTTERYIYPTVERMDKVYEHMELFPSDEESKK